MGGISSDLQKWGGLFGPDIGRRGQSARGTFTKLPETTGFYTGRRFIYDRMGRVVEQSNPTERWMV